MIVKDPNYEERKAQEKLARSEDQRKDEMLAELRKESTAVICLAIVYAEGFKKYGIDITKPLEIAQQQDAILQRIYSEGYHKGFTDGIARAQQIAQEQATQINPMSGNDEFRDVEPEYLEKIRQSIAER